MAPYLLAGEERVGAAVLVIGAADLRTMVRPEIRAVNYLPRVTIPTLMLNGKYDMSVPYETAAKPTFDLLGVAPADKRLNLYETDHFVPHNDLVRETQAWLGRYLGQVK